MMTAVAPGTTIGALLRQSPLDPLEARILLAHALSLTRVQLITQSERVLDPDEASRIGELFSRRLAGEPIAYIIGEREFFGLPFATTPAVLIPRPETELLVELALARLEPGARVLDLGTGSGAIAIAIAHTRPDVRVTAVDASLDALAVAGRNATRHQATVEFRHSNWYAAVGDSRFDLVVSNPPYIVAGDPHLAQGDLRFEPQDALTDHGDGLSALRHIVAGAPTHLVADGWLLVEHGYDQAVAVQALMQQHGLRDVQSWNDLAGIARATGARR